MNAISIKNGWKNHGQYKYDIQKQFKVISIYKKNNNNNNINSMPFFIFYMLTQQPKGRNMDRFRPFIHNCAGHAIAGTDEKEAMMRKENVKKNKIQGESDKRERRRRRRRRRESINRLKLKNV
jgi:hypothetical protein